MQLQTLFALCAILLVPAVGILVKSQGMVGTSALDDAVKYQLLISNNNGSGSGNSSGPHVAGKTFRHFDF
jgi:hypothetical protein